MPLPGFRVPLSVPLRGSKGLGVQGFRVLGFGVDVWVLAKLQEN